jgi:hypothetical protein
MNQKYEITKVVLESKGLVADESLISTTVPLWWVNPRQKQQGGLRLTDDGFNELKTTLKCYELRFEEPIAFTNELIIWIDQNISCPFYLTNKKIWVFGERTAIQLVLFSGNVAKYHRARKRSLENNKTN